MAKRDDLPTFLGGTGGTFQKLPEAPSLPAEPFPKYQRQERGVPVPTPQQNAEYAAEITRIHKQGLFPKR